MTELTKEHIDLLKGSEVYVPMTKEAGFVVSIPQGAQVTLSKDQGALQMEIADPDGPQATMRATKIADIEADPERAMHMQTVKGLDEPGTELTIARHDNGMQAYGNARMTQGVTSITDEQATRALPDFEAKPVQKAGFQPS